MWDFPTSTMRPSMLLVATAVVCLLGGFAAGYVLHPPASASSAGPSMPLPITAAGTLAPIFPSIASAVANEPPGASAPLAAQQYQGSLAAIAAISSLQGAYDVAAAADFRLIPHLLEPSYASFEI